MAIVGYARVSSWGQSLQVQRDKLAHCDKLFEEIRSGASGQRPRLNPCLEYVRDQHIDTGDATGRLLFNMLGAIGQFETEIRAERQMDGILKAKENGVKFGRSKALGPQEVLVLQQKRASGLLIKELMREYGLSKATIYRYLEKAMG